MQPAAFCVPCKHKAKPKIVAQLDTENLDSLDIQNTMSGHVLLAEDNSVNQFIVESV